MPAGEGANSGAPKALEAERAMTFAYACGLRPNSPPNGVWLRGRALWYPTSGFRDLQKNYPDTLKRPRHGFLHRQSVYHEVANTLDHYANMDGTCSDPQGAFQALQQLKDEIRDGTWVYLPPEAKQW